MIRKTTPFVVSILLFSLIFTGLKTSAQNEKDKKTIDKIIAIVGDNVIFHSDVENQYMQYVMQGNSEEEGMRCQIFEEMLFQKMLLNKAEIDSITVDDSQVNNELDRRMRYFIRQIGSEKKLEEYYNKSIVELKEEMRSSIREQLLVSQVQQKLTSDVSITPSEVKDFYNSVPRDSLPKIPEQYKIAEITLIPEVSHEDKMKIKEKLRGLRQRILDGSSFKVLAGLYSEDPGSADNGGEVGMFSRGEMYPEFEAAAFDLEKGEISPIIETEAGFHIIKLINREGQYVNVRHILLRKKVSAEKLVDTKFKADSLRQLIQKTDSLNFPQAAKKYSDTYEQTSAGIMLNRQTGSTMFNPDQLKKNMYFKIKDLSEGDISEPFQIETDKGTKAIRMVKVLEKTRAHRASLERDYDRIKTAAMEEKKSDILKEWVNEQADDTFIKIQDEDFRKCDFTYNWF
ncbi:MAG: peptidylprolyl isomerase [Bacteroidales bacterium]|nr:peptidylprolyl isomerase [Bacteroidales bacterium]MCF8328253.1 peptidylprolyl isomerase [Bacteroidales bacterium]